MMKQAALRSHYREDLEKARLNVAALVANERLEMKQEDATIVRAYTERLISEAVENGDRHTHTMEMAKWWLVSDTAAIHKLFQVSFKNLITAICRCDVYRSDSGSSPEIQGHLEILHANAQGADRPRRLRGEPARQVPPAPVDSGAAREPLPEAGAPQFEAEHEPLAQLLALGSAEGGGGGGQQIVDVTTIECRFLSNLRVNFLVQLQYKLAQFTVNHHR